MADKKAKKIVKKKKKVAKPKEEKSEIKILTNRINNLSNHYNELDKIVGGISERLDRIVYAISHAKKVKGL